MTGSVTGRLGQRPVDPVLERAHQPRRDVGVVEELRHRAELARGVLQLRDRDLHGRAVAAHVLHVVPLVDNHRSAGQVNLQCLADVLVEHVVVWTQHQLGVLVQSPHRVVLAPQVRLRDGVQVLHVPDARAVQLLDDGVFLVVPPARGLAPVFVLGQLRALLVVLTDGAVLLAAAEHRVARGVGRALQLPHELVQLRVRARAQVDLGDALRALQRRGSDRRELGGERLIRLGRRRRRRRARIRSAFRNRVGIGLVLDDVHGHVVVGVRELGNHQPVGAAQRERHLFVTRYVSAIRLRAIRLPGFVLVVRKGNGFFFLVFLLVFGQRLVQLARERGVGARA